MAKNIKEYIEGINDTTRDINISKLDQTIMEYNDGYVGVFYSFQELPMGIVVKNQKMAHPLRKYGF